MVDTTLDVLYDFVKTHEYSFRILLASIFGAIVGFEREIHHKDAGMRTYAFVCVSSCIFAIVSLTFPHAMDTSRIAAQVVSAVGFLGAGVIWFNQDKVIGLTSAGAIWAVAAIGLAIGAGLYEPAVVAMVVCGSIFVVFEKIKKVLIGRDDEG